VSGRAAIFCRFFDVAGNVQNCTSDAPFGSRDSVNLLKAYPNGSVPSWFFRCDCENFLCRCPAAADKLQSTSPMR
jgi:hypothetical protein